MANILQRTFSKCIFVSEITFPIDNKPAMACCLTGHKSLPEPMMTKFTDEYVLQGFNELIINV